MRRWVAILLGALIAFGGISLAAGSADAKTGCPKDKGNGHGNQYPPGQCKLQLSASAVRQGQPLTASGDGFTPGATVMFALDGVIVGSAVADPSGHAALTFYIPLGTSLGRHTVTATGPGRLLTATVEVLAATQGSVVTSGNQANGAPGGSAQSSGGGSSLATTGAGNLVPLAGGGAALVGLGAMTLLVARRRRNAPVSS